MVPRVCKVGARRENDVAAECQRMLDALMYPPAELIDTLRVLYMRQGNEVEDETIFVTACACCLEAFEAPPI
jgi:hypothetical protein